MSLIGDWSSNVAKGFGKAIDFYVKEIAKPIGRGISTAVLLTDKDNPVYKDGFQIGDVKKTFDDYAGEISPGQAFFGGSELPVAPLVRGGFNLIRGENAPTFAKKNFDLYDEEQRKQAFETEMTGKLLTGTFDAAVTWYSDPLSKALKVGKVARAGTDSRVVRKVFGKDIEGLLDTKLPTPDKADEVFRSTGWSQFIDQAVQLDATALLKHRVVARSSNPELLASVLGDITTARFGDNAAEVARTVLKASVGDKSSLNLLKGNKAITDVSNKIARAQGELNEVNLTLKAAKEAGGDVNEMLLKDTALASKLTDEIDILSQQNQFFRNAVELADKQILGIGASKFAAVEKLRAAKAVKRGAVSIKEFQNGRFGLPVKVVTFLQGQAPSGWIATKGIQSSNSSDEIVAFMNQIKPWNNVEGSKLKRDLLNRYARAASDVEREDIVRLIENKAVNDVLDLHGFNNILEDSVRKQYATELGVPIEKIKTTADAVFEKINKSRINLGLKLTRDGHIIDEDGAAMILSSQLKDGTPMVNVAVLQRVAAEFEKGFGATRSKVIGSLADGYQVFNALWRPSVLLRLGYTVRNVSEGALRVMAYLGSFEQYMGNAGRSLGESARNSYLSTVQRKILLREGSQELGLPKTVGTWADLEEIQIRSLRTTRQDLFNTKKALADSRKDIKTAKGADKATLKIQIKKQEIDIKNKEIKVAKLQKEAEDFANKYNIDKRIKKFDKPFVHRGITLQGVFDGDIGLYGRGASSAVRRNSVELRDPLNISAINLEGKLIRTGSKVELKPPVYDEAGKIVSGDLTYFDELYFLSRQFRNDEVTRKLLVADDADLPAVIEDIIKSAKTNPKIREDLLNSRGVDLYSPDSIRAWANAYSDDIQRLFPDRELRKAIGAKDSTITTENIRQALSGRNDLQSFSAAKYNLEGNRNLWEKYQEFTSKWFRRLGAIPEDTMVRHPLYKAAYEKSLKELVDRKLASNINIGKEMTNGEFNKAIITAHRMALKETQSVAYTIARYSSPAQVLSFVAPFIQAYSNTMRVWSRLAYENPSVIGRGLLVWNAPEKSGVIEKDERTGETYLSIQVAGLLPDWLEKKVGNNTFLRFPKQSLNLVFQGEPWWSPGFGPIAQVAASEIVRNSPDINEQLTNAVGFYVPARGVLDAILPMGPSKEAMSYDLVLSSSLKRLQSLMKRTADTDYMNTLQGIYATEKQRYKQGLRPDAPTFDEVSSKTNWMMTLRFVGALTLPFQPRFDSEFAPYIKIWQTYQDEGNTTIDGVEYTPSERFYKDYPDYFTLAYSRGSSTTGMDFTTKAVNAAKNNRNLVADVAKVNPYLIQLITNDGKVEKDFDSAVYVWQLDNSPIPGGTSSFRGDADPLSEVDVQDVKAGWIEYNKLNDALDAEMEKYGVKSYNSEDGRAYKQYRDEQIAQIAVKFPAWEAERRIFTIGKWRETLRGINKIVEDDKFLSSVGESAPAWGLMKDYLQSRDWIVNELELRKYNGDSASIDAASNQDLRESWDAYTTDLKNQNTQFSSWYNRFLDNDPLEKI